MWYALKQSPGCNPGWEGQSGQMKTVFTAPTFFAVIFLAQQTRHSLVGLWSFALGAGFLVAIKWWPVSLSWESSGTRGLWYSICGVWVTSKAVVSCKNSRKDFSLPVIRWYTLWALSIAREISMSCEVYGDCVVYLPYGGCMLWLLQVWRQHVPLDGRHQLQAWLVGGM